jgi:pimeloyl-ACP methyl ester carboxylesterase
MQSHSSSTQHFAEGFLHADGFKLEYTLARAHAPEAPLVILLHEGLGCARLWGDFPRKLGAAAGGSVLAYSREGYGASSPVALPRPLDYMQQHAREMLPRVIDATGAERIILVGHSDGASIAAAFAGHSRDQRLRGLVLIAPHFFVEEFALAEIAKARIAFESSDLRRKLARWHEHVDVAFHGWNGAWLDPRFKAEFDLRSSLRRLSVPVLAIQGADDQYGTLAQVEAVAELVPPGIPRSSLILPGVKHAPHREAPSETVEAIAAFVKAL